VLTIDDINSSFYGSERNVTFLHFIAFLLLVSGNELMTRSDISRSISRKMRRTLAEPGKHAGH
jgi:hypothetical protein